MTDTEDLPEREGELSHLRARNNALEMALREAQGAADLRAIQAELKSEALRHGIVDLDGLKLIDRAGLAIDEQGEVKGVSAALSKLQREKPWLFSTTNSSSLATAPPMSPTRHRLATEMSLEEWRTARLELLRRS